jgi:LEA14-like dessication related protein
MNRRTAFAAAAALVLVACAKPEPPRLTPVSAKITAISAQGVDVDLDLEAENPNGIDLTGREVKATITLDGRVVLGTATVTNRINLPAHKKTMIAVPVSSHWRDLSQGLELVTMGKDIPYKVDGTVEIGGDSLNITVPFHVTGILTRAQLMAASLNSLAKIPGFPSGAK